VSPVSVASIMFASVFGGALLGMGLRSILPEHHLSGDSKDVVKLSMGLIGTMTALLLGLLVASAKTSYDLRRSELIQMAANYVMMDRALAHYGPETKESREILRDSLDRLIRRIWSADNSNEAEKLDPAAGGSEIIFDKLQALSPKDDAQRMLKAQALSMAISFGQMRWLLFEQTESSISMPFLVVLVLWLTVIFGSFGLFAPHNMTVVISLLLAALSVSGAIFLILELDTPFEGLIQISSAPLRSALAHLGH
jgi:Protein of unknown function (DUF4239)